MISSVCGVLIHIIEVIENELTYMEKVIEAHLLHLILKLLHVGQEEL